MADQGRSDGEGAVNCYEERSLATANASSIRWDMCCDES